MTGPIILDRMQAKAMGYVKFPWIEMPHAFTMFTATLKRICTEITHNPKTANNSKLTHKRGTSPKTIPAHKSEAFKATKEKQSKQTDEPVIPKIKWNSDSIELNHKRLHFEGI